MLDVRKEKKGFGGANFFTVLVFAVLTCAVSALCLVSVGNAWAGQQVDVVLAGSSTEIGTAATESASQAARSKASIKRRCLDYLVEIFEGKAGAYTVDRKTHPYVDGMLHVMLPLVQWRVFENGMEKPLRVLKDQIEMLVSTGFARKLYLGPVYPQSVLEYDGARNDHFYWPAFFDGVDPRLGTKSDYVALVKEAKARGIDIVQDVVFEHIGYVGRDAEERAHYVALLKERGIEVPDDISKKVFLWGEWRDLSDPAIFRQEGPISQEAFDAFDRGTDARVVLSALDEIQTGSLFGLSRLNLENPEVLTKVIKENLWFVREAGVSKFRIDAAKHIPIPAMREIVKTIVENVKRYNPGEDPALILEYWTENVSRIGFMMRALAPYSDAVYFFDYPLALRIRNTILVNPDTVSDPNERGRVMAARSFRQFADLLGERAANGVRIKSLIPIVMDHDFLFPIYNGSERSLAQLAFSYAIAYMMSGNAPHFYNGFDRARFGPESDSIWTERFHQQEVIPRLPLSRILRPDSRALAVVDSLARKLTNHEVLVRSDDVFVKEVSDDSMVIERRLDDVGKALVARFSRTGDPGREERGEVIWEYTPASGPSVRIYEVNREVQSK